MKKRIILGLLFAGGCWVGNAPIAAREAIPLPPGPLPANPEFARWKVTITKTDPPADRTVEPSAEGESTANNGVRPTVVEVTKTGAIVRRITTESDGTTIEVWSSGPLVAALPAGAKMPTLMARARSTTDFPELGWISAKNFAGVQKVSGRPCLVFRDRLSVLTEGEINDAVANAKRAGLEFDFDFFRSEAVACLDQETRLPVVARKNKETYVYQFSPPPSAMQSLPPAVEKLFRAEEQRMADLQRKPARS